MKKIIKPNENEVLRLQPDMSFAPPEMPVYKIGVVTDVNPRSFSLDVKVENSEVYTGVQVLNIYGAAYSRDLVWLNEYRGAQVLLVYVLNRYFVLGTIPQKVSVDNESTYTSELLEPEYGGDAERTYKQAVSKNYKCDRPTDLFQSDKVLHNSDGSTIGIFKGGIAKLKASPLAQIIAMKFKDLIRIVARNLQIFTDFGEMEVKHNEQGKTTYSIKGGADFKTETHPNEAKWTVQIEAGHHEDNPDSRLWIKVNDKEENESVILTFDIKGNMTLETTKDSVHNIGQDEKINIARDREESIGQDEKINIARNREETIGNDLSTTVSNNAELNVMNEYDVLVGADKSETVTGSSMETVAGSKTLNAGKTITIVASQAITISAPKVSIN